MVQGSKFRAYKGLRFRFEGQHAECAGVAIGDLGAELSDLLRVLNPKP